MYAGAFRARLLRRNDPSELHPWGSGFYPLRDQLQKIYIIAAVAVRTGATPVHIVVLTTFLVTSIPIATIPKGGFPRRGITTRTFIPSCEPTTLNGSSGLMMPSHWSTYGSSGTSAARRVGRDLGTMFGTADRIRELGTLKELEDAERRLYKVCGAKSGSPQKEPPGEPKGGKPATGGGGEKPPDNPPARPTGGGTAGLPLNCGCDGWRYKSWGSSGAGLIKLSAAIPRPPGRILPAACGRPGSGAPGGPRRVSVRTSAARRWQDSRYARPGRGSTISPGPARPIRFTEAWGSSRLRVAGLRESGRTVNEEL